MAQDKLSVLLVVGGDSPESDVSIETGKAVFAALKELGHRVFVADPYRPEIAPTETPSPFFDDHRIDTTPPDFGAGRFRIRRGFVAALARYDDLDCNIVFNGLHGGAGEDGTFQAVLDYMGIRYTGSGALASAAAMDKEMSKRLVAAAGVRVAKHVCINSSSHDAVISDDKILNALSLPVVVKPNHEGSSVGVTIVTTRGELAEAVRRAKAFGGPYLIETFVPGKEITAAVMDGAQLPLLEIRPKEGFYDYRNKYQAGSCEYLVPAPLDDELTAAVLSSAQASYGALGCRGYARVDFRLSPEGEHVFLEANTLPGLTGSSLFPKAARGGGIDYPELIDRILRLAFTS